MRALTANGCAAVLGAEFCKERAIALSHRVLPSFFHVHMPVVHKKYVSKDYLNKYTTASRITKLDRNTIDFLRSEMQSCRIFMKVKKKKSDSPCISLFCTLRQSRGSVLPQCTRVTDACRQRSKFGEREKRASLPQKCDLRCGTAKCRASCLHCVMPLHRP